MRTEVVMPQMGESVAEGTLTKWLKTVGQNVERDEPLFELTTDKVDADVPSPVDGVLVEIHVQPGQTVEVNAVVAIIDTEAAAGTSTQPANGATAAAAPVTSESTPTPAVTSTPTKAPSVKTAAQSDVETLRKTKSTPLVRKIAAEHGISDLGAIAGSGVSGRVTKKDILAFIAAGGPAQQSRPVGRTDIHLPPIQVGPRDRVELMSPQRQRIAEHMIASRATSAHAQTVHELDFSNVAKARKKLKAEYADRGVRLTYTAFIVNALAQALKEFPLVNASVDGNNIVFRGDINIGVAVDTGTSLIVPVIRNCDELNLQGTARAVTDVAERARNKKLRPEDVQGGTFTLTNPGIFGSEFGVPILNQPQAAILATGAIKKRVVVDQKTDAIMVKPTSVWCMSFDHRIVDGATADRFISRIRDIIENWEV